VINNKKAAYWLGVVLIAFAITAFILIVSSFGNATVTKHQDNAVGFIAYSQRPVQYLEASVVGGSVHDEGTKTRPRLLTTIRFQPTGTYGLFTEDFTFCSDVSDKFNDKSGVIVLAFSSVMHHSDCYDLYSVHEIKTEPIQ
jgi:hypothetical protein